MYILQTIEPRNHEEHPALMKTYLRDHHFTGKRWNRLDWSADVLCVVTRDDKTRSLLSQAFPLANNNTLIFRSLIKL